jgi:hypothetical protein
MPDDTAVAQVPAADLLPQLQPRNASVVQQLIDLLQLFELVGRGLAHWSQGQQPSTLSLASFASQVVALDETTLDQVRQQRWVRLQFHADVLAYCNVGILLLLEGLAPGSLILADLGYFSFPWFDYLTGQGLLVGLAPQGGRAL